VVLFGKLTKGGKVTVDVADEKLLFDYGDVPVEGGGRLRVMLAGSYFFLVPSGRKYQSRSSAPNRRRGRPGKNGSRP
jgi:hypothetical protein